MQDLALSFSMVKLEQVSISGLHLILLWINVARKVQVSELSKSHSLSSSLQYSLLI